MDNSINENVNLKEMFEYQQNLLNKSDYQNYDKYLTWTRTSMAKLYARRKAECA